MESRKRVKRAASESIGILELLSGEIPCLEPFQQLIPRFLCRRAREVEEPRKLTGREAAESFRNVSLDGVRRISEVAENFSSREAGGLEVMSHTF